MRRSTLAIVAVAASLAGGCAEPSMPQATAADLQRRVAEVRTFVENGQVYAARQRLERLTGVVNRLLEGQELDSDTALEILSAIEGVEGTLDLAPERSPVTEPTAEPTTPPPSPDEEGEEGNGHGNDGDKGGGHGDEGHGNDD